jgi:UDP-N-acetylglucosamine--N-acetylmuramyl-(pentapeptide) pyrophosphoryl-undecaprenol N-acetylglucosamine transferase
MRILITGGHLTPALSFIDYIQKQKTGDKLFYVGRHYSQDAVQQESVERYEVEKINILFLPFSAVRLGHSQIFHSLPQFFKSIQKARRILQEHKIEMLLSFGGYVAVPFAFAAFSLRIPIVTHEQTLATGFANMVIAFFARKVAVSFAETAKEFPAHKVVVTGNPLREGVFLSRHQKPEWLPREIENPILLIMGGNQGSQALNELVLKVLPELVQHWTVVHQCGKPTSERHYKNVLETAKTHLPEKEQSSYFVHEWIDDEDLFWLYRNSFGALSRAGANSTQEIAVAGLPSILVPLPSAHKDEQRRNARWLVNEGASILIEQAALNEITLFEALEKLQLLEKPMRESLSKLRFYKDAAEKLYAVVVAAHTPS